MSWNGPPMLLLLCLATTTLLIQSTFAQRALMAIDLGGEFMKIAIVKPGVPMEIVLNKESARKTRTIVAFRDGHRQFANEAYSTAVRFPEKAFWFLTHVIGRHYDDPVVEQFRDRFPYYSDMLVKDQDRGTVLFKQPDGTIHSTEELLAMMLEKAREYAQDFADQKISEVVITVPPYFTQAERRAVMKAADLVGLEVLQLMTDTAAVALNYGVFRRKNFNATTQHYMFYDMGATSTVVSVVGYKMVKTQVGDRIESNPQLTVKGVGYDRNLGGLEMTLRLRDHLAQVFNEQQRQKNGAKALRVQDNARAMATLLQEAERVKKVLSANSQHLAQVEGLLEGEDFRYMVTREKYLDLISDLLQRMTSPVDDALKASEVTWPEISEIILMGGGSRLPRVHDILLEHSGKKELGKSINTDEAAALGAVYQAAFLGKGFKVKTFHVRDANLFPINVEFDKQKTEEEDAAGAKKIKRTLFARANYYPQKKVMTFNKHYVKDFTFDVRYGDLDFLSEDEKKMLPAALLTQVNLKGVDKAVSRRGAEGSTVEYRGVKAHFRLDHSGLLHLDLVEASFEDTAKDDSTWSKLGNAIGSMFGGSEEEGGAEKPEKDPAGKGKADTKDKKSQEKEKEEKDEKKEKDDKSKNKKAGSAEKSLNKKLKAVIKVRDFHDLAKDKFLDAKRRLVDLRRRDDERAAVQKAKNELEGYIIEAQDRLEQAPFEECSTEKERSSVRQKLSEASDWLYEQPDTAKRLLFTNKLRDLKALLKTVENRMKEKKARPSAIKDLNKALTKATDFLESAKLNNSRSERPPPYTKTELFMLDRLINETKVWLEESQKEQAQRGDKSDPTVLTSDIQAKVKALEREVRYLQNKPKSPKDSSSSSSSSKKPKAKAKVKKTDSNDDDENVDEKKRTGSSDENGEDRVNEKKRKEEEKERKEEEDEDASVEVETDEAFNADEEDRETLKSDTHTDSNHIEL